MLNFFWSLAYLKILESCSKVLSTTTYGRVQSSFPDPASWIMFTSNCSTLWECKWREALTGFQILQWAAYIWAWLLMYCGGWAPELPCGLDSPLPHNSDMLWTKFRECLPPTQTLTHTQRNSVALPKASMVLEKIAPVFYANIPSVGSNLESMGCTRGNIWIQRIELILLPLNIYPKYLSLTGPRALRNFLFSLNTYSFRKFQFPLKNTLYFHQKCPVF